VKPFKPNPRDDTVNRLSRTNNPPSTATRRHIAAAALLLCLALQTAHAAPLQIDLPAQPLERSLAQLARQAGLQLLMPPDLVRNRQAAALKGSIELPQALDALLRDSGLRARVDGGTLLIEAGPARAAEAETTLPAIKATAKAISQASHLGYLAKDTATGALGNKAVLDTPFSVTVIDSNDIVERGAKSIGQIFFNDPSVYTPTNASSTDWWGTQIRGLGVRNNYVDDIPAMLYWGGDFPAEVVESVTALKGLTGFMYGFGEPGGALSYTLKRPTPTPETSVSVGYGNPGLVSLHVDTSHRLENELALRANLATEQGTAYNAAKINRVVGSLAIDKQFGASFKWFSTLVLEDSKTTGEPLQFYMARYDNASSGGKLPSVHYDYDKLNVDNAYYKTKSTLATTGIEWRINDEWKMKTQAGISRKDHRSRKAFAYLLNAGGDYSGRMYDFADRTDTQFMQAMLQGTAQLAGMKHELVAGLGTQRFKELWSSGYQWTNDFDGTLYTQQLFQAVDKPGISLDSVSADNNQKYAFLSDTVHFNAQWQAIVGLRFTRFAMKDLDGDPRTDSGYTTRATSPTVALIYKPGANTSVYGSYVEAMEPGTRVTPPYANAGEIRGATVSKQAEVGIKHQSGTLDYTAALFRIQRANQMDSLRGLDRYLTQDGLVLYQGAEVSSAYRLNRNLTLGLGAVYLSAKLDKVSPDNSALQGNTPSNAPKWQIVSHAEYRLPGVDGLKLHGALRYFGAAFTGDDNQLSVPGRTIANAGVVYDFRAGGRDLTLIANLNNVFNRKYWASGGWSQGNVGEARNLAVTLRAQF
jgi:iron complex outermembrane receptor protein